MEVLLFFIIGIGIGYFNRKRTSHKQIADKLVFILILLLLFSLGLSVGANPEIIRNFKSLGVRGILFGFLTTFLSVIFAAIIYKIYQNRNAR